MEKGSVRRGYRYPSSFDEALNDAVEKRVSKVEESFLVEVTELIKKRTSLQATAGVEVHRS